MNRTHWVGFLVAIVAASGGANDAFARNRMYNPATGQFMSRDLAGTTADSSIPRNLSSSDFTLRDPADQYYDGTNVYQYVAGNPLAFADPAGLWSIVVDLPANRAEAGKLYLYDRRLGLVAGPFPARGQGKYTKKPKSPPWWEEDGDTPTGIWTGELMGVAGDKDDTGPYGKGDRIALMALSGHAKVAVDNVGRKEFRIHGGRSQWLHETSIKSPTDWTGTEEDAPNPLPNPEDLLEGEYYGPSKVPGKTKHFRPSNWGDKKTQLPANTNGCIRLVPDDMRRLVFEIDCLIKTGEPKQGRVAVKGTQAEAPKK